MDRRCVLILWLFRFIFSCGLQHLFVSCLNDYYNKIDLPLAWTNKTQQKLKTSLMVQGWRLETKKGGVIKYFCHNSKIRKVSQDGTFHLCLRLRWSRGGSSDGALKMDLKMGTYFLKITAETVKFLSSLLVLWRNSCGRLAMSCHFFILLKNSIRLGQWSNRSSKVHQSHTWIKLIRKQLILSILLTFRWKSF